MFTLGFGFVAVISVGWLIGMACIFQKYDPEKRSCTASEVVKLTFTSVTLYLAGSILIIINSRPAPTTSISGSVLEAMLEYATLSPTTGRWLLPDGNFGPLDQEIMDRANTMVSKRLSYMRVFDKPPPGKRSGFLIVGTEAFPMNIVCIVEFPSDYDITLGSLTKYGKEYQVSCLNGEWG